MINKNVSFNKISKNTNFKDNYISLHYNNYNDYEMNSLRYEEALKIDNRTFFQYYLSLLKRKVIILFTFFVSNDYNSRSIKICLLFFSFALEYGINTLFFNDTTMHKIYLDEGKYDFIYQIPFIIYSTLISGIITGILEFLSLSEDTIIEIKNNNNKNNKENQKQISNIHKIKKCLKIKFISFFISSFLLLLFLWYYISCFCVVYKNTQIHVLKDTLISFVFSMIYPFILCFLPGIFRIPSLRADKKNRECTYKFSQFIESVTFFMNEIC